MYEFVFFDQRLHDRFLDLLEAQGVPALPGDPEVALSIGVSEDVDDDTLEVLEAEYDRLLDEQASLTEAEEPDAVSRMAVQYTREDGSIGVVRLEPEVARKVLSNLSYGELQALVQHIVDASREPVRPLCKP